MRWLRCVALKTALATRPVEIVPAELYEAEQTVSAIPHTEIIKEILFAVQQMPLVTPLIDIVTGELFVATQTALEIPHTEITGVTQSGVQPIVLETQPIGTTMGTE
jgi:hypothetical protein